MDSLVPIVDLDDPVAAQPPPPAHPNNNTNNNSVVVDLLDDDDDLQIVAANIVHPPVVPDMNFLIADDEIEVVDAPAVDEVQAVSVVKAPPSPSTCTACAAALTDPTFTVSRCKHALCVPCAVRCSADLYPPPTASTSASTDPDAVPANFDVRGLKSVPMCVVNRCRAPLSSADVDLALAPLAADRFFTVCFNEFKQWRTSDTSAYIGPSHIVFPEFTAEMAAQTLQVNGTPGEGELFVDDFFGACDPLWIWDADCVNDNGSLGAWMCLACGMYHSTPSSASGIEMMGFDALVNAAVGSGAGDGQEIVIPDHPSFPHCEKARAFAVMESINRLTKVEEEAEESGKKPARASTRRGRGKRYRSARSIQASKRRRSSNGFAKGTGYAGRVGAEWKGTSSKILEKTARVDAATAFWLTRIRCFILRPSDLAPEAWPGYMRVLLRECKLTEHLTKLLINDSIMDVNERVPVYVAVLRVASALCDSPSLRRLVGEPVDGNGGRSLASLIQALSTQAALLTTGVGNEEMNPTTKLLIKQIRKSIRGVNRYNLLREKIERPSGPHSRADSQSKPDSSDPNGLSGAASGDQTADAEKSAADKLKEDYMAAMKEVQFQTVQGLANASSFRNELARVGSAATGRGQTLRRIASEVATLFSSLPLSWSSTILLRVDEDCYNFLRACVFGPEDSPYECGAFLFDIFLPNNYPDAPPKFKLLTTGGGRVRFNPNLYANGKVCLSLLGTWSGPSWTPASTLLQVLVSIQSLIMVPEPYFNEPGLERQMGTATGTRESARYNQRVQTDTANVAILDALRNPYNEFRSAIHTHFKMKRGAVERCLQKWFGFRVSELPASLEERHAMAVAASTLPTQVPAAAPVVQTATAGQPSSVMSMMLGAVPPNVTPAIAAILGLSSNTQTSASTPDNHPIVHTASSTNAQSSVPPASTTSSAAPKPPVGTHSAHSGTASGNPFSLLPMSGGLLPPSFMPIPEGLPPGTGAEINQAFLTAHINATALGNANIGHFSRRRSTVDTDKLARDIIAELDKLEKPAGEQA